MPRHPSVYAKMLRHRLEETGANCWLVNTGWTGGPYGVGRRIPISVTRQIVKSIVHGGLARSRTFKHLPTGFNVPLIHRDFVPPEILEPEKGWSSRQEYDEAVNKLMKMFEDQKK